jgi:hypothetical protein
LYDGNLAYERDYLQTYLNSIHSHVTLVLDEERIVGASTCIPLAEEGPEFQQPFLQTGMPVDEICYLGESILLPQYRKQGLGKEFFFRREAHAKKLALPITAFCAVDRPTDHPLRPADYAPLDGMWSRLGYHRQPHLQAVFCWKEIHEVTESPKTLTYWLKQLA